MPYTPGQGSTGGAMVQLRNGQWVPRSHPLAIQELGPENQAMAPSPQVPMSVPGTIGGAALPYTGGGPGLTTPDYQPPQVATPGPQIPMSIPNSGMPLGATDMGNNMIRMSNGQMLPRDHPMITGQWDTAGPSGGGMTGPPLQDTTPPQMPLPQGPRDDYTGGGEVPELGDSDYGQQPQDLATRLGMGPSNTGNTGFGGGLLGGARQRRAPRPVAGNSSWHGVFGAMGGTPTAGRAGGARRNPYGTIGGAGMEPQQMPQYGG